ncbi:hypothetical protein BKP64_10995 [Marinobacter salinus]|uniref:Phage tail protein n=1 Tax=Marinobacter salinus TaxID=1874317 RepID=A0A1D9GMB6_9GAMM|nr:hypothetical protein [Marinobacter salinus]AOY88655.1 hypothetical protein BKP64_10995 [Marinobacter salinus]
MCGIGGKTIAEARRNISYVEFFHWVEYRRKRGTLNLGMRTERAGGLVASLLANIHSAKDASPVSFYRFAPHHDEPELTLSEAMETWK